jgi:predicted oxidoreductase (fatty acid repression mutant protein)
MIKPIARMSRVTVTRMKTIAAGRDFMAMEQQRNVVAAFVSTAEGMTNYDEWQALAAAGVSANLSPHQ